MNRRELLKGVGAMGLLAALPGCYETASDKLCQQMLKGSGQYQFNVVFHGLFGFLPNTDKTYLAITPDLGKAHRYLAGSWRRPQCLCHLTELTQPRYTIEGDGIKSGDGMPDKSINLSDGPPKDVVFEKAKYSVSLPKPTFICSVRHFTPPHFNHGNPPATLASVHIFHYDDVDWHSVSLPCIPWAPDYNSVYSNLHFFAEPDISMLVANDNSAHFNHLKDVFVGFGYEMADAGLGDPPTKAPSLPGFKKEEFLSLVEVGQYPDNECTGSKSCAEPQSKAHILGYHPGNCTSVFFRDAPKP